MSVAIGGIPVPVLYAAAQSQYLGVDQVNVGPLPASLAGRGTVDLALVVEGVSANPVILCFSEEAGGNRYNSAGV